MILSSAYLVHSGCTSVAMNLQLLLMVQLSNGNIQNGPQPIKENNNKSIA